MNPGGRKVRAPRYDIVCVSHLRWDFVWQRPQQLLSRFAQERHVLYFEEPVPGEGEPRLEVREGAGGVHVAVPHIAPDTRADELPAIQERLLHRLLDGHGVTDYVLWCYTPMAVTFTRSLEPRAVVYDCMDELSAFAGAPEGLAGAEEELLRRADVVFTGGRSLFEAKRDRHRAVHLFPSSVDTSHFARARGDVDEPTDQAEIPRPRIGYFGVVDERMDLELLRSLAQIRPDWHLVAIGPVVKIDPASLPQAPNIHWLGARDYADLPSYVGAWDVATMPFARNESTRFISPTKTPEYLAAGLPVVSTSIADVVATYGGDGLVRIADEPHEFAAACEAAMAQDAEERMRKADSFLAENSWDYTWADMAEVVDGVVVNAPAVARPVRRLPRVERFDWLVVGAGFAGSVLAERLASSGERVLVTDRRSHIGGNAHDHFDDAGILVHRYGPHIFHTNSREVFEHLSRFTEWRPYEHRVLASVDGMLVPFPINIDTVNALFNLDLCGDDFDAFLAARAEPVERIRTSEDVVLSKVGRDLYLKFFRNYTRKQWDLDPSELDASVTSRVPTRSNRDCRYFTDTYQAMPLHGYTRMFERMLAHPNIKVMLNADFRELDGLIPYERLVYTGPIDEYFDFRFGKLPYRSLEFQFVTHDAPRFQPAPVVNYPNEHLYTRATEFKYLTGQEHPQTTVVYEYPRGEGDPYYPVPRPENADLYAEYKRLADADRDTVFVGRLATYKYYNMDQVVAQALATFRRLGDRPDPKEAERDATRPLARGVGRSRVYGQPSP